MHDQQQNNVIFLICLTSIYQYINTSKYYLKFKYIQPDKSFHMFWNYRQCWSTHCVVFGNLHRKKTTIDEQCWSAQPASIQSVWPHT